MTYLSSSEVSPVVWRQKTENEECADSGTGALFLSTVFSNINGVDTKAHNDDTYTIIRHIRTWLNTNSRRTTIPGVSIVWNHYQDFLNHLPELSDAIGFHDINQLSFADYCILVEEWLEKVS